MIIKRLKEKLERAIRAKVAIKVKEMKLKVNEKDLKELVDKEINKILASEKENIEKAAVVAAKDPSKSEEAMGSVLQKIEAKLDNMPNFAMPPMPDMSQQKEMPVDTEFEGKNLKTSIDLPPQAPDKKKIGTPIGQVMEGGGESSSATPLSENKKSQGTASGTGQGRGGGYGGGSRYMVPYGFMAPLFKQMTGPQIIEKVQELYHVPYDQGEAEKKKVKETYSLIPELPKPGETTFAWAYIHWDPKARDLVYELIEPVLNQREKEMIKKLEEKVEERLDIIFLPEGEEKHKEYLRKKISEVVDIFGLKSDQETAKKIEYYIFRDFIGLNKIEALMHDPNIEDISCDGVNIPVYVFHRKPEYNQMRTNVFFTNKEELDSFVIRLAQKGGKSISVARPLLDASLPDGSRLQATLASDIARRGSNFTIRKFLKEPLTPTKLIDFGTASSTSMAYLWFCIEYGKSILVSGTTATGKTSFLNAISLFMRPELKVVSIEDTAELMLPLPNWVPQVSRPGYGEKSYGAVEMYDLLKAALRQRPDYVIVGEVRGKEASTMFQGMATGHPALSTIHSDSLQRLVDRLTTPPVSLSPALLENLDVIIFLARTKMKGKFIRRINKIYEVAGVNVRESKIIPNKVFEWDPVKDEINMTGKSMILKKVADFKGVDYDAMFKELERRSLFIEWLKMNDVVKFTDFGKWVQSYYTDTEKVMTMVVNDVRRNVQKKDNKMGSA
ncbi:MAG: type II/IV secretion system ATPase subunit [Candidatus Altiarchaeota archaeon]|nr:type II/IV secretion system ATPase subunit [Candidatus Altiarchaeota archaeon]